MTKRLNTLRPIVGPRRNIELKARDRDRSRSLEVCTDLGAEPRGTLEQRDTYFTVEQGRLKLREEAGAKPHLIAYTRPDRSQQGESSYRIVEVDDAAGLLAMLAGALGVRAVVAKRRHLYLWQGVRIHLDEVEDLGEFIEFEAVAPDDSDLSREEGQVRRLREAFSLVEGDLVAGSYCDLIAASR